MFCHVAKLFFDSSRPRSPSGDSHCQLHTLHFLLLQSTSTSPSTSTITSTSFLPATQPLIFEEDIIIIYYLSLKIIDHNFPPFLPFLSEYQHQWYLWLLFRALSDYHIIFTFLTESFVKPAVDKCSSHSYVHRSLQDCVDVLLDLRQPIRVNPVWSWTLRGADMKRSNCVGSELSTLVYRSTLRTLWVTLAAPLTQSTVLLGHPCGPALWQFSHKMWCEYEANVPQDVSIFCLSALNWPIDQSKEDFHILLWYFVGHDFFPFLLAVLKI